MTDLFPPTQQARDAVDELARAIDLLGTAAVQLIMAEREECALTLDDFAKETQDKNLKQAFIAGAEAIRERWRP
jgi:hypothetical protein